MTRKRRSLNCCSPLAQEYKRLLELNSKLTDFQRVLRDAMGASERSSWNPSSIDCLPQASPSHHSITIPRAAFTWMTRAQICDIGGIP